MNEKKWKTWEQNKKKRELGTGKWKQEMKKEEERLCKEQENINNTWLVKSVISDLLYTLQENKQTNNDVVEAKKNDGNMIISPAKFMTEEVYRRDYNYENINNTSLITSIIVDVSVVYTSGEQTNKQKQEWQKCSNNSSKQQVQTW